MADKPVRISTLRKRILDAKGLERAQAEPGAHARIATVERAQHLTPLMLLKELELNEKIEDLIAESRGTIYVVGKRLGVHPSTVYLWRKRLELVE